MCSVGSGMVLAIGDLAGATFVTLLAGTATQFARRVAYGPYARSRSKLPCGWASDRARWIVFLYYPKRASLAPKLRAFIDVAKKTLKSFE